MAIFSAVLCASHEKHVGVVLLVPQADSDAIQRVNIDWYIAFEELVETIHETIPCTDVKKKPILSYKLASAPPKSSPYALKTSEDWEGCREMILEEVASKAKKCGAAGASATVPAVQVTIELGPKNVSAFLSVSIGSLSHIIVI